MSILDRLAIVKGVARLREKPTQPPKNQVQPFGAECETSMRSVLPVNLVTRYDWSMTKPVQTVLADALRLDPDARAELVAEILASLDGPADDDAESAWDAEIERRIQAIEAGEIPLEPWDSVKRRIEKDLLGR